MADDPEAPKLTPNQRKAARMYAYNRRPEEILEACDICERTFYYWLDEQAFQDQILWYLAQVDAATVRSQAVSREEALEWARAMLRDVEDGKPRDKAAIEAAKMLLDGRNKQDTGKGNSRGATARKLGLRRDGGD